MIIKQLRTYTYVHAHHDMYESSVGLSFTANPKHGLGGNILLPAQANMRTYVGTLYVRQILSVRVCVNSVKGRGVFPCMINLKGG